MLILPPRVHTSNYTLNELAGKLNETYFFRAHPAFIVNLNYVKEILNFGEVHMCCACMVVKEM